MVKIKFEGDIRRDHFVQVVFPYIIPSDEELKDSELLPGLKTVKGNVHDN